ncbi:MAG: hypothetical protein ABIP39_03445 [Polyangiaceae bacterium]
MTFRAPIFLVLAATLACDKEPPKVESSTTAAAVPSAPATPVVVLPKPPVIRVDDKFCSVNGEQVDLTLPDAKGRIGAILIGAPLVAGEIVEFDAPRDAHTPKVAALVAALKKAKAKGVVARTPGRDGTMGTLPLVFEHAAIAPCTVSASIGKDGSISVWPAGGGGSQRFTHGFAGPDLTLGGAAIRKGAATCDSQLFVVGGEDNITWGLTFDLAMAIKSSPLPGGRASQTILHTDPPTPGHKVDE